MDVIEHIQNTINENPVVLFMKGTPDFPQCGFSMRTAEALKAMELEVTSCAGSSRAIITAGGVSLSDIDMRTMRSKKIGNLFFAGEMIDLDGPTGGYNLQVCWSTGYLAGMNSVLRAEN